MRTDQVLSPAIHVRGLTKSYQKNEVLRGVDLEVEWGSMFALLGSVVAYFFAMAAYRRKIA
jgi:ABC-2 type transport system ATP-binding protein